VRTHSAAAPHELTPQIARAVKCHANVRMRPFPRASFTTCIMPNLDLRSHSQSCKASDVGDGALQESERIGTTALQIPARWRHCVLIIRTISELYSFNAAAGQANVLSPFICGAPIPRNSCQRPVSFVSVWFLFDLWTSSDMAVPSSSVRICDRVARNNIPKATRKQAAGLPRSASQTHNDNRTAGMARGFRAVDALRPSPN
jgi:hypothetical protein